MVPCFSQPDGPPEGGHYERLVVVVSGFSRTRIVVSGCSRTGIVVSGCSRTGIVWRFTPARLDGIPVPVVLTVTVMFTLQ
jgi:hypothetical protein